MAHQGLLQAVTMEYKEDEPMISVCIVYRGSNMSAHVLLNLLNELRKSDKMQGLLSILSLFRNWFNKFNNTGAQMLDFIYHMTLKSYVVSTLLVNKHQHFAKYTRPYGRHLIMLSKFVNH